MEKLQGKRLLIISSDSSDLEIVKAAKELGVYTVCCDRYTDWNTSPAKFAADEAWDIDYTDTETVAKKCIKEKIDGVIAGYGEDRVLAACRISNAIGTPFYATEAQINFTRNKRLFKETCERYGVSVPKEYCRKLPMSEGDLANVEYPVIVKPADNGGRKGISICHTREQLLEALSLAKEFSGTGEVVVEEYLTGLELSAVYTIVDGEISFSCLNDKYISQGEGGDAKLCDFVVTPSKYYDKYLKEVDGKIKTLLRSIGARNGVANFQLIAARDTIKAFEMGYRVNGNNDFKVIRKFNQIDFLKMLITYSLTGNMGGSLDKDNPQFSEYYCTYVVHLRAGTIKKLNYKSLVKKDNLDDISVWRKVGDVVQETGTNAHKAGMIKFVAKNEKEIIDTVRYIKENIIVEDENQNDMCMSTFDINRVLEK